MKSETVKHTPGPWIFAYGSVYRGDETINDENAPRIALMDRNEPTTQPTERDANARLIAAAPDLLEACRVACAALNEAGEKYYEQWEQCKVALEKATQ